MRVEATSACCACALVLLAMLMCTSHLIQHETWRGCVISSVWCEGKGFLSTNYDATLIKLILLLTGVANLISWMNAEGSWLWKATTFIACVSLLTAALVPMSGDALDPVEQRWSYIGWNDVMHDASLVSLLVSGLISLICSWFKVYSGGSLPQKQEESLILIAQTFTCLSVLSSPLHVYLVWYCPSAQPGMRVFILCLEIIALLGLQISHSCLIVFISGKKRNTS